ncbi:hypothetical protein LCGC14_0421470 [marine sediment metagenome]|uniref:DUF3168 domain-containing protein n=1 Tax=marine sediment metagenome TaxID=412755 RepID=A0A0F9SQV2_9ZZZZ
MMAEVAEAVIQKFEASPSLRSALGGNMFFQQAGQTQTGSYVVFSIEGVTQEEIMGTADDNITDVELQFSIFTDVNDGGVEIASLTDLLTEAFDWVEINVNGFKYIKMQRESIAALGYVDEMWQTVIMYSLGIQKE